jgi:hypothetical protein
VLLIKAQERRATLLGLNPPIGHAVRVVQHAPEHRQTSTDRIEAALNALECPAAVAERPGRAPLKAEHAIAD